jgi:hypothetical protein
VGRSLVIICGNSGPGDQRTSREAPHRDTIAVCRGHSKLRPNVSEACGKKETVAAMATVQVRYIVHDVDRAIDFYTKLLDRNSPPHATPLQRQW